MEEVKIEKKRRRRRRRRQKRDIDWVSTIILVVAMSVFLFAAYKLITIFFEYQKGSSEYESLENIVISQEIPSISEEEVEEVVFKVDFDKLKEINPDVLGWIRFENPEKISYPVVAGIDNSKYLTTTFEGKYNSAGTLFVDMDNNGDFKDLNTFIYGHNMKNGSMFSQLRKYKDKDFGVENPYFSIYTPDGKELKYQIFAVCIVKDTSYSYTKIFNSERVFADYIEYVRSAALYQTDVTVSEKDTIVSLSTCTNVRDDERLLVHAVKIGEKIVEE